MTTAPQPCVFIYLCIYYWSDHSKVCTFILCIFVGNHSSEGDIDYYPEAISNFHTIPAKTTHYPLNIVVIQDSILEDNELFQVTVIPEYIPVPAVPQSNCPTSVGVIIVDDDGNY